mgnify:CR=1 FL=1|tara:strand:- start:288 stop:563 length:276 start_codon:yes stop_codon:yes gene_type:complete
MQLSRFESTRIIGLRSLALSGGACAQVSVQDPVLRNNFLYVAALELYEGKLDMRVVRGSEQIDPCKCELPTNVAILLDTLDGGSRSVSKLH